MQTSIYQSILKKYWGFDQFRPLQEEIITSVANGKDTLGLMPTGGGKSIVFQVYSLSTEGICIVITPLIALMKDQVQNLKKKKIKALAIYSGMTRREIDITLSNALYGDYKFLYVSPERLDSDHFREYLLQMPVNLITVDEAHCISQWGYDFRPAYLRIARLRKDFPKVPVLALTATATPRVIEDIQNQLLFPSPNVLSKSFYRQNLIYLVREKEDKLKYLSDTLAKAKGSGIVYVRNRKKTIEITEDLRRLGHSVDFYHAGLSPEIRNLKQDQWMRGETRVIVTTNAFGMGIDKPDVRFVIHIDLPDSLEAYFQEAGRGGRDGNQAVAVLLYNNTDKRKLHKQITDSFPEQDKIRSVYDSVCNYLSIALGTGKGSVFPFSIEAFSEKFNFQRKTVYHSLKLLERQGYLSYIENTDSYSRIHFLIRRDELYQIQTEKLQLDNLIKLILRSYTGLFTEVVSIDEAILSQRLNVSRDTIYQQLKMLAQLGVIEYVPQRSNPIIVMEVERIESKRVAIAKENYGERKKAYEKQIEAVIHYAQSQSICRSRLLLDYFGETKSENCGQCDVCTGSHDAGLSNRDYDKIEAQVINLLDQESMPVEELTRRIDFAEEKVIQVVRWMIDNNQVVLLANGCVKLNR